MSDRTFTTLTDDAVTAVQSVQDALVGVSVITPGTSTFTALQTAVTGALGTIETNLAVADANMAALVTAAAPGVIGGVTAFDGVAALNAAGSAAADEAALTGMLGYISRMATNLANVGS